MNEVNLVKLTIHITKRQLISLRGFIAILFSLFSVLAVSYLYNDFVSPGSITAEFFNIFNNHPELKAQWYFFDGALTKLVTIFIAPIFIFDAVSGDRSKDMMGIVLSRPLRRRDYILTKLAGSWLAFGITFIPVMAIGYPLLHQKVPELTADAYFATTGLMCVLGFFTMCIVILISTLSRSNLISFIAAFGVMAVLLMPNASKYTSSAFMNASRFTPHYYATYFTAHSLDPILYVGFILLILLFSIPFVMLSIIKFKNEDL